MSIYTVVCCKDHSKPCCDSVCDFWRRSRLIALAQEKPPGSSGAQRVDLFLIVKPQFIKRVYHVCLFLGEKNPLFYIPAFYLWLGTSLKCEIPLCVKSNDLIPIYKCVGN